MKFELGKVARINTFLSLTVSIAILTVSSGARCVETVNAAGMRDGAMGAAESDDSAQRDGPAQVGKFMNDWTRNAVYVQAFPDPKIKGITCYLSSYSRGLIDRVIKIKKESVFEDPSNSAISCEQTGPIQIGKIEKSESGEDVFNERLSLIFKWLNVRRIYDDRTKTLVYVSYSSQIKDASPVMGMSTVSLRDKDARWSPQEL